MRLEISLKSTKKKRSRIFKIGTLLVAGNETPGAFLPRGFGGFEIKIEIREIF